MTSDANPASPLYVAARKYSVTIAGHETSIRIEPPFWDMLVAGAARRAIPINALIARIDLAQLGADGDSGDSPNLASAIRLWGLDEAKHFASTTQAGNEKGHR